MARILHNWLRPPRVRSYLGAPRVLNQCCTIGTIARICADPVTGETRRFLTAPPHAEVTGVITTPDGKTMFVGIQHPGEDWRVFPTQSSSLPDNGANGPTTFTGSTVPKPRSAVIVITKDDSGVIGT